MIRRTGPNRLKNFRALATRFDKRAYVFHGTVTVAAIRLWLRPRERSRRTEIRDSAKTSRSSRNELAAPVPR